MSRNLDMSLVCFLNKKIWTNIFLKAKWTAHKQFCLFTVLTKKKLWDFCLFRSRFRQFPCGFNKYQSWPWVLVSNTCISNLWYILNPRVCHPLILFSFSPSCTEEIRLWELVKLVYSSIFFSVEIESVKQKTKHQRVNMPPKHELSYLENYSESLTTICTRNISLIIWLPNVSDQSSKILNCAMSALL